MHISSHYLSLTPPFTWPTPPGPYRATTCRGRELNYGPNTYFFDHTRTWRASPDEYQPNAGATSETAQTWKTIHTKHTLSHPKKANMEWWLRRPNDIRGPWGPKVSWHSSYRWGKTPKKPRPGNLSRPGIEPGPAAWQARMLPLAPQRWTFVYILNFLGSCIPKICCSNVIMDMTENRLLKVKTLNYLTMWQNI